MYQEPPNEGVALRRRALPPWLGWLGLVAGATSILRPAVVTQVPVFIATFQPMFLWLAATSVVLVRSGGRSLSAQTTGKRG